MQFHSIANTQAAINDESTTKRRNARQVQHMLECNLGRVLDLSTRGMRIKCRRVPSNTISVSFPDHAISESLKGQAVWSRAIGNFHHEVGIQFENVSRELDRRLHALASNHRFRRAI